MTPLSASDLGIPCGLSIEEKGRLDYARLLWKNPRFRAALLAHWSDPRHPHAERWEERAPRIIARLLEPPDLDLAALDDQLRRAEDASLREWVREIPPVFGSFFRIDSACARSQ